MEKKCKNCGKMFEPRQPHFSLCPDCFSPKETKTSLKDLLLNSYYDEKGHPRKEVYLGVPEQLAKFFATDKNALASGQLRKYLRTIFVAKTKARRSGIEAARPILYKCVTDINYQLKREIIPKSFEEFMKHHLAIAEKDKESLAGFYEHLDSILISRRNYNYAMPGSWISKALRISRCALVTSVRI